MADDIEILRQRVAVLSLQAKLAGEFDSDWAEVMAAKHAPSVRLQENGEPEASSLAAAVASISGQPSAKKFKRTVQQPSSLTDLKRLTERVTTAEQIRKAERERPKPMTRAERAERLRNAGVLRVTGTDK